MTLSLPEIRSRILRVVIAASLLFATARFAPAQSPTSMKLDMTINIDSIGNAKVDYDLSMPAKSYAVVKQTFGDAFHVIRSMEQNAGWLEMRNIDARFEDRAQSVVSKCDAVGLLRTTAPGKWLFDVGGMDSGFELLDIHDNQAIFGSVSEAAVGMMRMYTRVNLPEGSQNVQFDARRGQLTYDFEPELEYGSRPGADYELLAQEHIMSSLAKIYSTEQSELFAAKNLFTNTGNQRLYDYRVRFRINGYSSWSPWKKCRVVYPGQTVLDYFYPVMDIDRLADLTGTRHAMVETEVEYTTEDGDKVQDTDARRVQILSRNEVIYSSRPDGASLNWFESFDLAPYILTTFTNGTDPVMQQFAGRISALAGGPAASLNSEHAVVFLNTMWATLQMNHLSYQTSPGLSVNDYFGQHVKYGRDVLRNRAGTCIDLAILWASAAESVGLKPYIAIIPGHAFPIIELPNGNQLPIEATMIGTGTLEEAVQTGFETLKKAQEKGMIMIVDIDDLKHNQNIRSLDLPKVSEDVLVKWGYNFDELLSNANNQAAEDVQEESAEDADDSRDNPAQANALIGDWQTAVDLDGMQFKAVQRFLADGQYGCVMVTYYDDGSKEVVEEKGTYIDHGTHFEFNTNLGQYNQNYRWNGNGFDMEFDNVETWLHFTKVQ
ncbi:MAG: hypothetical protein R3C28_20865 [Pirellulaceae bacterium]